MKIEDNLFTLIKSLSKTEKGYLKKHSNFHVIKNAKNNYIKIFNAIDAQDIYDEPKLLKKFKNERFINQFAVAKNYLYDIILESLEAYNKTISIELRSLLTRTEILVDKGLWKQAKKILRKAEKNAAQQEDFTYMAEIKLMEQTIDRLQHNGEELKNNIETRTDELKKIAAQIENSVLYEELRNKLYLQYIEKGSSYTSFENSNFGWIMENPLLKSKEKALSIKAKIAFNELYAIYYEYIGDFEKSYTHSLNIRQEIQRNPAVLKIIANSKALFFYQHGMRCSNNGLHREAMETMHFLERLPCKTEIEENNISFMVIHVKLKIYFQMKKIKECLDMIPEIELLLENGKPVDNLLKEEIYQQLLSLVIISKQYKVGLKWLIKKNMENIALYNHNINYMERMIEMIIHSELGNFEVVDNRIKSAHRFLYLKDKLNSWENTLLSFFRYQANDKKKPIVISNVILLLESETMRSLELNSLSYFVAISWLKNKIATTDGKIIDEKQLDYPIVN